MKQVILFTLLTFLPFLTIAQTANSDLLNEINSELRLYNSYGAELGVSGNQLMFKNDISTSYIPFKSIDFRINYKHKSIDIYCIDGSQCIEKGGSNWNYYNMSMIENGQMAKSIFTTLDKCRELRSKYVSSESRVSYSNSETDILRFVNRQFDLYNKYYSRFDIEDNQLVFYNQFGQSKTPLDNLRFRINESSKSLEFYCKDGSKCIEKYDFNGDKTVWLYYNVSLIDKTGNMSDIVYKVKSKCDELKNIERTIVDNSDNSDNSNVTTARLLIDINDKFEKYNTYKASLEVDEANKTLTYGNSMSSAQPIPFSKIDFRINYKHKSIDIYCIDGSKCIEKGGTNWDYYNVSLTDNGKMSRTIFETLDKCRELRAQYVSSEQAVYYSNSESDLLRYLNRQFNLYNKYYSRFDVEDDQLVFSNKFGTAKIPFNDIYFKVNEKSKSIEFHCRTGNKCIEVYDADGRMTGWKYYNISLIDNGEMFSEMYKVLSKCKKLKAIVLNQKVNKPTRVDKSTTGSTEDN
jgi:hypothetical protein